LSTGRRKFRCTFFLVYLVVLHAASYAAPYTHVEAISSRGVAATQPTRKTSGWASAIRKIAGNDSCEQALAFQVDDVKTGRLTMVWQAARGYKRRVCEKPHLKNDVQLVEHEIFFARGSLHISMQFLPDQQF
jgi:hypothetical protein